MYEFLHASHRTSTLTVVFPSSLEMMRHHQRKKVSANSQVVAAILRCVQALRAQKTRGLPLGHQATHKAKEELQNTEIQDTRKAAQCQGLEAKAEQQSRWRQLRPRDKRKKTNSDGRAEGRQDGSSNPHRLHSLWWSNHLDLHRERSQRRQFLKHTLTGPWNMAVHLTARHWRPKILRKPRRPSSVPWHRGRFLAETQICQPSEGESKNPASNAHGVLVPSVLSHIACFACVANEMSGPVNYGATRTSTNTHQH